MGTAEIVEAIGSVLPSWRVGHHDALITDADRRAVHETLTKGIGTYEEIKAFEEEIAGACGVARVCAVSSGTCALQLALLAVGVRAGDEVIVPTLTFAGAANAVCNIGAFPHFVDSDLRGIRPYQLQNYLYDLTRRGAQKRPITAMIATHLLGEPCDMEGLRTVAERFNLALVEDAAQALGSTQNDKPCGGLGTVSILSFNNNKIVTTNGGGAVLSNNSMILSHAWKLATTARVPHPWLIEHDGIAFNYRMGDINAALGLSQIRRLRNLLALKRKLAGTYSRALHGVRGVELVDPDVGRGRKSNHWLTAIRISADERNVLTVDAHKAEEARRDELLKALHARGIGARCLFTPLHRLPQFQNFERSNIIMYMAEDAWRRTICLPSGLGLVDGSQ